MSAALKLELFKEGELLKEIPLDATGEMWIGRDDDCVIRIDDRAISRKHALFRSKGNQLEIEKKSKFGELKVNGKEISHVALVGGERIEFGTFEVRVKLQEVAPPSPPPPAPVVVEVAPTVTAVPTQTEATKAFTAAGQNETPAGVEPMQNGDELALQSDQSPADPLVNLESQGEAPKPAADFDFAEVDQNGATRVLPNEQKEGMKAILQFGDGAANVTDYEMIGPEVAIGRSQKCAVVLEDKKASRKHSIIKKKGNQYFVQDLGSANGTILNGAPVDGEHELQSGDILQIGDTSFTFKLVQADYEQKKVEFIQVPESEIPKVAPPVQEMPQPQPIQHVMQTYEPAPQAAFHGATAQPQSNFAAPPAENKSIIGKYLDRYRAMNTKQQIIYGAVILAAIYFLLDDEQPAQRARLNTGDAKKSAQKAKNDQKKMDRKPGGLPTFETLTPDQQRYITTQYDLAFDLYKNREYDSSLLEVGKIFSLVQDYKNAREIEMFAREGKRKLEGQEEERKKKEQERQAQIKLQSLLDQAGVFMEKKKYKEAEAIFPDIELIQPENLAVGNWRKQISEESAKIEQAHVEKVRIEKLNKEAQATLDKAEALITDKKYFDALDVLDELATRDVPDAGIPKKAKEEIKRAEGLIASERDPLLSQAKELEQAGKYTEAYKLYQKAVVVDPTDNTAPEGMTRIKATLSNHAKSIYAEGVFAESFSDFDSAEKKYREVLEAVPNDDDYYIKAQSRLRKLTVLRKPAGGETNQ